MSQILDANTNIAQTISIRKIIYYNKKRELTYTDMEDNEYDSKIINVHELIIKPHPLSQCLDYLSTTSDHTMISFENNVTAVIDQIGLVIIM